MLALLPFLLSTAHASSSMPLRVSAEVRGTSASWIVSDLQPGELVNDQVPLGKRRHAEVTVNCSITDAGDAELDFTVYVVRNNIFDRQKRELVGTPVIVLPNAQPDSMLTAVNLPFTNKGLGRAELVVWVSPVLEPEPPE